MRCHKCAFVVGLLLTHSGLCRGQDLPPGEIRLLGRIASIDSARKTFVLIVDRFVVPPNREGTLKEKKNKTITVDEKTVICLFDNREQKLSISDLKVGMSVAATGKDLGEGRPLPAREVLVWQTGKPIAAEETPPAKPKAGLDAVQEAMRGGALDKALTELTPLLTADWQNQYAWRWAVKLLGKAKLSGRSELANRFKAALLSAAGENSEKQNRVLAVLARGGFADVALPELEAMLTKDPLDAAALTGKALAHLERYEIDKASGCADEAVKVNGLYAPGYVMKGKVQLFMLQGDVAAQTLQEAIQKDPNRADAHGLLAQACLQLNDEASADAEIRRCLELDAENPEGLFALGILQERRGQKREAQKTWDKYLEVDPASERAWRVGHELVVVSNEQITDKGAYACPAWSPEGHRLVFCQAPYGTPLVVQRCEEPGKVQRITPEGITGWTPDWSPDRRHIAYMAVIPRKEGEPASWWWPQYKPYELHVIDLKTGEDVHVAPQLENVSNVKWSSDGRFIMVSAVKKGSRGGDSM